MNSTNSSSTNDVSPWARSRSRNKRDSELIGRIRSWYDWRSGCADRACARGCPQLPPYCCCSFARLARADDFASRCQRTKYRSSVQHPHLAAVAPRPITLYRSHTLCCLVELCFLVVIVLTPPEP